ESARPILVMPDAMVLARMRSNRIRHSVSQVPEQGLLGDWMEDREPFRTSGAVLGPSGKRSCDETVCLNDRRRLRSDAQQRRGPRGLGQLVLQWLPAVVEYLCAPAEVHHPRRGTPATLLA